MTSPRHGQSNGRENIAAHITLPHGINQRQHTHCHHCIRRRQSAPSASLVQRQQEQRRSGTGEVQSRRSASDRGAAAGNNYEQSVAEAE
jgi:hypothetical protein